MGESSPFNSIQVDWLKMVLSVQEIYVNIVQ